MTLKMYINKILKIFFLIIIFHSLILSGEKTGTTSANFLKISPLPKIVSLGNAYSALNIGSGALVYNPAGACINNSFDVSLSYNKWFGDISNNYFGVVYKSNVGFFGISILNISTGDIEITTPEKYNGTGYYYNAKEFLFGLTYSDYFTDKLQFGITTKFIKSYLFKNIYSSSTFALDIGTIYNFSNNYTFGITLKNLGNDIKYINESSNLPTSLSIGFCGNENVNNFHNFLYAIQLLRYSDSKEIFSIGFEYGYNNILFMRIGSHFIIDEKQDNQVEKFSTGFGINLTINKIYLKLDYSYSNNKWLSDVHRISISLNF